MAGASLSCDCPVDDEIPNVPIQTCPDYGGQIQKLVLQRKYSTGTTLNTIVDPTALLSWSPLLAAVDSTKVVQTPFIEAPTSEAGAKRTFGGGNETLDGIELVIGREPTTFEAQIRNYKQSTIKALKEYMCETVGVYLINDSGKIGLLADDPDAATTYYPIPITSLFVGDKGLGGLEAPDQNMVSFSFFPNWSDNLVWIEPSDFNAKTDLATP